MNVNGSTVVAALCRWAARIVGILLILLVLYYVVGEGMQNPFTQPIISQIETLGELLMMIALLVGWRWELTGGIMYLFGWCLLSARPLFSPFTPKWFFIMLNLPGLFYLTSALLRHYNKTHVAARRRGSALDR